MKFSVVRKNCSQIKEKNDEKLFYSLDFSFILLLKRKREKEIIYSKYFHQIQKGFPYSRDLKTEWMEMSFLFRIFLNEMEIS